MPEAGVLSEFKRFVVGHPIPSDLAHRERLSRVTGLAVLSSEDAYGRGPLRRLITTLRGDVRRALAQLEERWEKAGFVRIHRSLLVSLAHVDEIRMESGRCTVVIGGNDLQVSRRHVHVDAPAARVHRAVPGPVRRAARRSS